MAQGHSFRQLVKCINGKMHQVSLMINNLEILQGCYAIALII